MLQCTHAAGCVARSPAVKTSRPSAFEIESRRVFVADLLLDYESIGDDVMENYDPVEVQKQLRKLSNDDMDAISEKMDIDEKNLRKKCLAIRDVAARFRVEWKV